MHYPKRVSEESDELEQLRQRLEEAEQTLSAIRHGEVDSLVVDGPGGALRVFALEGSTLAYRVLLESLSEGAATLDEKGVVVFANGRLARMLETPLQRVMGSAFRDRVPARLQPELDVLLRSAATGEARCELALKSDRGTEVPIYLSASSISQEGVLLFCLVATDLREHKRFAEIASSEQLTRGVLEQSAEAIIVCDQSGCVIRASHAAADLAGRNPLREPFDRSFPVVLEHVRDASLISSVLRGDVLRTEPAVLAIPGRATVELLVSAAPLRDQQAIIGAVISMVDVSVWRRAERALREVDRRRTEFLAMLSHELRNPLAPMRTALYLMDHVPPASEQALRARSILKRQLEQLSHLVDELLDATRMATNKIQLKVETIDLNELVRGAAEDYREIFTRKNVRLEVVLAPDPVMVQADSARLLQVAGNLLQNSAKFTRPGDRTAICVERCGEQVLLRIKDTGPGIAPELLGRLFEPFSQGDTTLDRAQGGLGLGLSLVKQLVEMHGGDVQAYSGGAGGGAEFVVRLPAQTVEAPVRDHA